MQRFIKLAYFGNVIFLGILFFTAGMSKLVEGHNYIGIMGPVWLEDRLAEFDLGLFARLIAYSQVTAGFLLLSFRFRFIGSLFLAPMIIGILGITISQNWTGTPYVVSAFLLQLIYIFWHDRAQYLHLISGKSQAVTSKLIFYTKTGNLIWVMCFLIILISISISKYSLITTWISSFIAVLVASSTTFVENKLRKSSTN